MRRVAEKYGYPVYCKGEIVHKAVTTGRPFASAVNQALDVNQRQAVMVWIGNKGPFWEEELQHDYDTLMEYKGSVVTESSVGEAAYFVEHERSGGLVSFVPSGWDETPIRIKKVLENTSKSHVVLIPNYRDGAVLELDLQRLEPPISSWNQLEAKSRSECSSLTFSSECFEHLNGVPFQRGTANGILRRLRTLNDLMSFLGPAGTLTYEGTQFREQHFVGKSARFSDSSDTEKAKFKGDLTFPHPNIEGETLFCSWHGKIQKIRIHFSFPNTHDPHLYVVYIGVKRTLR